MESVVPTVIELLTALFLRKRPTLVVLVVAVAILFVPFPDTVANAKLSSVYGSKTMKAAQYVQDGFAVNEVPLPQFKTTLLSTVVPQKKATQLLVKVHSAAINPVDYKIRVPLFPFLRWFVPNGVARDFSGTVEMVVPGNDNCKFKQGDEIFGLAHSGTLQEYLITTCDEKAIKPKALSFNDAAGLGVAAGTSYFALTKNGSLEGKRVLVIGGSGACGSMGVKFAHLLGAHVTSIVSGKNFDFVKEQGADELWDYTSPTWKKSLNEAKPFDIIYDTVSSAEDMNYVPLTSNKLAKGGKYIAINGQVSEFLLSVVEHATGKHLNAPFYDLTMFPDLSGGALDNIAKLAIRQQDPFTYAVDTLFPALTTNTVEDGFAKQKARRAKGKIIYEVYKPQETKKN